MRMGATKISMLSTFLSLQEHCNKRYTCLKRATIQDRLKRFYHISISLSAIDQHLGDLNRLGFINIYQRHGRHTDGTVYNLPSNRMLTKRAFFFLIRIGVKISVFLFKKIAKVPPVFPKADKTPAQLDAAMRAPGISMNDRARLHDLLMISLRQKPA